ncbi:alpha-L-fucosidase [Bifidobacterium leontopitheci]|uniref:alpha-L-fucosidase n=1 Tax=Bifidobacterium leontopitheci TaxID=2650774 RepID=A0A6I1GHF6_9BIFI|nr:alpha-L-fucosidase [Bifidobacterium leontopitheci]KAB7791073.1 alpha-L-fucosidase [Bifidobacterium leontopitheci]
MNEDYLANIRPAHRQLAWQRMEMYAFTHFGMNTMTDREWGLGHEDPALFNPTDFDADQWMEAIKAAGMTGVILTCKHHDGFCLWPSAYTKHSVASSPWKDGKGDVVREVSDAARRHGLKFGVYLSPWDRTEATYGSGKAYDDYYVNQLVELLTHYGPIFSVWLDGACGEGPNGKRQQYDWQRYYNVVRALQPEAVISVSGPDVRWCGNEAGHTRENEWSVVPERLRSAELTAAKSQQADDGEFSRLVRSDEEDLGSRKALAGYDGPLAWYPSEVNTSTRPGWFYHANEDAQVRTPEELFDIWASSVGGNATFLLNIPPAPAGRIAEADVKALAGLGRLIADFKSREITDGVTVTVSSTCRRCAAAGFEPSALLSTAADSASWRPTCHDMTPRVTLDFGRPRRIGALILREDIAVGQRIDMVDVYADEQQIAHKESVGYQRIIRFDTPVRTSQITVRIPEYRLRPQLASVIAVEA